jgi:hypothetical protein
MNELEQLRRRVAATESREQLHKLIREAQGMEGAEDLIARAAAKLTKLGGKPLPGGTLCPQLKQVIEPWSLDEFGNMTRTSYSVDAAVSVARVDG